PWFFSFLYDQRYAAAAWMAPLLTLAVWVRLLNQVGNSALLALGMTRVLAATGATGAIASLAGGILGFLLGGIPGFIVGLAAGDALRHVAELIFLARAGAAVHQQDVLYTGVFLGLAAACYGLRHVKFGGGAFSGVVAAALPLLLFSAVA